MGKTDYTGEGRRVSLIHDAVHNAIHTGYIAVYHLPWVLAGYHGYQDVLPELWTKFEINVRRESDSDISTYESRVVVWMYLFERWTRGTVAGVHGCIKQDIKRLPVYSLDEHQGILSAYTDGPEYVVLHDLQEYFIEYLQIPLPNCLFPEGTEIIEDASAGTEKNRPSETTTYTNAFIQMGDFWEIYYHGEKLKPVKNVDGIGYVANLIRHKEINVSDLYETVNPKDHSSNPLSSEEIQEALYSEEINISQLGFETMDDRAIKDARKAIAEMEEDANDPSLPLKEREAAKENRAKIINALTNGKKWSHSGGVHMVRSEVVKRHMDNVRKSIKAAIQMLKKINPALAEYLEANIVHGQTYLFRDQDTDWNIIT